MAVALEDIKKLRALTGAGLGDCKKALAEANGNMEEAIEIIRKKAFLSLLPLFSQPHPP